MVEQRAVVNIQIICIAAEFAFRVLPVRVAPYLYGPLLFVYFQQRYRMLARLRLIWCAVRKTRRV